MISINEKQFNELANGIIYRRKDSNGKIKPPRKTFFVDKVNKTISVTYYDLKGREIDRELYVVRH